MTFTAGTDKGTDGGKASKDVSITKDGITLHTTISSSASTGAGMYGGTDNYRFYKGSKLEVSSTVGNITKVVFTCTGSTANNNGPLGFANGTVGKYSYSGTTGTWTGDAASFTLTASGNQVRATKIEVTYTPSGTTTKQSAGLSYSPTTATAIIGESFTAPTLNNPNNLTVSYNSSDESVATIDASGAVIIKASGTTKITAKSAETDNYYAGEASYTLTVNEKGAATIATIDLTRGYSNGDEVTTVEGTGFTATFATGSNTNSPRYYTKGTAVRMYEGNTLTISSSTNNITKIEFTFTGGGSTNYGNLTLSNGQPGTYTPEKNSAGTTTASTWTGLSNSVTFTNGNNQSRIQSIKVTFKETSTATYTAATLPSSNFATSGNDRYATFSSDQVTFFPESDENLTFTTDVQKAYAVGDMMELTKLTTATATIDGKEVSGYFVPANTGVLLKVSFDRGTSITYYTVTGKDDVAPLTDNMLYPATQAMSELTNCYFYKLAYDDYNAKTGLGFYWGADNGAAFTAKTNGAYLAVPKSSTSAKSGFRFDGTTTGVNTINAKTTTNDVIYNIQGQRVGANYKGLVIVNGKKMMRK